MGRSILGTPETVCSFKDAQPARLSRRATTARPTWWSRRPARSSTARWSRRSSGVSASFNGPAAPLPQPAKFGGGTKLEARDLEQVHIALALEGVPQRDPDLFSLQVFTNVLGGGMSSRLFQEVREKRGLCYSIYAFHAALCRHRHVRRLCRHRRRRRAGADAGRGRRDRRRRREHHRGRGRPRQGADEGRAADGAGKLRRPRRAARAPDDDLWPADAARGDRRPDRGRDRRKRARRGPRADRARPAGDRGARPEQGLESAATIAESFKRRAAA